MNELTVFNTKLRMSSLEIAELTGKRHDNVMRDIRKQLEELEIPLLKFEETYKDSQGKEQQLFNLDEEQTLILASGYNVKLRQKIIKRWLELELENRKHNDILKVGSEGYKSLMATALDNKGYDELEKKTNAMAIARTVNKATSNYYNFQKMVVKADMNDEMLGTRILVMEDYQRLLLVFDEDRAKELLYEKWERSKIENKGN